MFAHHDAKLPETLLPEMWAGLYQSFDDRWEEHCRRVLTYLRDGMWRLVRDFLDDVLIQRVTLHRPNASIDEIVPNIVVDPAKRCVPEVEFAAGPGRLQHVECAASGFKQNDAQANEATENEQAPLQNIGIHHGRQAAQQGHHEGRRADQQNNPPHLHSRQE